MLCCAVALLLAGAFSKTKLDREYNCSSQSALALCTGMLHCNGSFARELSFSKRLHAWVGSETGSWAVYCDHC